MGHLESHVGPELFQDWGFKGPEVDGTTGWDIPGKWLSLSVWLRSLTSKGGGILQKKGYGKWHHQGSRAPLLPRDPEKCTELTRPWATKARPGSSPFPKLAIVSPDDKGAGE